MNAGINGDETNNDVVIRWVERHAHPLTTLDPRAPLTDLEPVHGVVDDAIVVGIGESTRFAFELHSIRHRLLRLLVEEMGFRSLALEEDWTKGIQLNEYLHTGTPDPSTLLDDAWTGWRTEEFLASLRWMRTYNQRNPTDPISIVGLDFGAVRALAYDAVIDYAKRHAPELLDKLEEHYRSLKPSGEIEAHIKWYRNQRDNQQFVDHARNAYRLIESIPATDDRALALQHARVILAFYEFYNDTGGGFSDADSFLAENATWWHEYTGDRIVYWGGLAHTANGNPLTASYPPAESSPATGRSAGSYLREQFGSEYVSIALTFDHGSAPYSVPPPPSSFAEAVLGDAEENAFLLDLHTERPDAVSEWLTSPTKMRVIGPHFDPNNNEAYHMTNGSLADWFDSIIHYQVVTPNQPLVSE